MYKEWYQRLPSTKDKQSTINYQSITQRPKPRLRGFDGGGDGETSVVRLYLQLVGMQLGDVCMLD